MIIEPAKRVSERRAMGILALVALATMVYITREIGVGIFLGVLTAFMLQPLYEWVLRRWHRRWLAQTVGLLVATFGILFILFGVSAVLVARGNVMVRELIALLEPNGGLRTLADRVGHRLEPLGIHLTSVIDKLRDAAASVASYAASLAGTIATKTFRGLLMIFFLLLTVSFVLTRGASLEKSAEEMLPISPKHTRALIAELRKVGRATLLGSITTGIAQGLFAGLIFLVVGLPEPLLFGVVTAVASLFPGVGTMLVWVPAGIYFLATGHVTRGILELGLSAALIIGFCDYVLRPHLVGGESMPSLLTFAALFGGAEAFGLIGLLLGPLLMALAVAVLRLYRAEVASEPLPEQITTSP